MMLVTLVLYSPYQNRRRASTVLRSPCRGVGIVVLSGAIQTFEDIGTAAPQYRSNLLIAPYQYSVTPLLSVQLWRQALQHKTLRPPFPREPTLDNLAKFHRMLPKPPPGAPMAAPAAAIAVEGAGPADRNAEGGGSTPAGVGIGELGRRENVRDESEGGRGSGVGGKVSDEVDTKSGVSVGPGNSVVGHYGPHTRPVHSAAEMEMSDREAALRRRSAQRLSAKSSGGGGESLSGNVPYYWPSFTPITESSFVNLGCSSSFELWWDTCLSPAIYSRHIPPYYLTGGGLPHP